MRCLWASAVLAAAGSLMLCANGADWRREGGYWVSRQTGNIAARGVRALLVTARGAVNIRGAATDTIFWTSVARIPASDGNAVRSFPEPAGVEQRKGEQGLSLAFSGGVGQPGADVTVVVPQALGMCRVHTKGGAVEALNLGGALEVVSKAGSLHLDRIHGPVTARTGGGDIRVGSVDGEARCFTGAGVIRVDWIGGLHRRMPSTP